MCWIGGFVAGLESSCARNGKGGLQWRFADKRAVGRDNIRTVLFVIYEIGESTNILTSFLFGLFNRSRYF